MSPSFAKVFSSTREMQMISKDKEEALEKEEIELEDEEIEEVLEEIDEHNDEIPHKQVEELTEKLAKAEEDVMRARAEVENTRRRAENDVANARKYAVEKFAAEVLLVRDSLDSAAKIDIDADNRDMLDKMLEGIQLTMKQLDSAMHKFNIEEVDPQPGDTLDPEKHQAMGMVDADGIEKNCIVQVIQKGYTINDRLLRPAMVMVAK
jgi:molecular chaperone GrpE